jgi:DNA replication protein DnaC
MRRVLRWQDGGYEEWDSAQCAFESAHDLSRVGYFDADGATYFRHLGKVALLVLDDLGAEMLSESWVATLDGLLAERFGRTGCRTVLTTNVSAKRETHNATSAFEQRYGARIARRIRESGNVVAVEGR